LRQEIRARDLAGEIRMVLPQVLLSLLPELVVVVALDDVATDARDLFHALIICRQAPDPEACASPNARPTLLFTPAGGGLASA